jgi:hypothetical protein
MTPFVVGLMPSSHQITSQLKAAAEADNRIAPALLKSSAADFTDVSGVNAIGAISRKAL